MGSKRATYYINCTTEEDGDRKTTFEEHTINMPTVYKWVTQFAASIVEVLERSYERSTNELKKLANNCLSFASHLECLAGSMEKESLVSDMKQIIAHCLAEDPELRTRGIKVTSAESIINGLQTQLMAILKESLDSSSIIIKHEWFQTFDVTNDPFRSYEYGKFIPSRGSKITSITPLNGNFYDWKFHFQITTKTSDQKVEKIHVVINECNVWKTFFDPKVAVKTFGDNKLSPMFRLCESLCQNNECPVESIISMFSSQTFRGQHENTAEYRAFIKINGDTIAGSEDICSVLAKMSVDGLVDWGIDPLTLPIRYGRYGAESIAKAFQTIQLQKGNKFEYMYKCEGEAFTQMLNKIGNEFETVKTEINLNDTQE